MYEGEECIEQISRIELVDQILSGKSIDEVTDKPKKEIAFCYCGEDWYVTVDKQGNINEYVMENSNKKEIANREKKECLKQIKAKGITIGLDEDTNSNTNTKGGTKK